MSVTYTAMPTDTSYDWSPIGTYYWFRSWREELTATSVGEATFAAVARSQELEGEVTELGVRFYLGKWHAIFETRHIGTSWHGEKKAKPRKRRNQ